MQKTETPHNQSNKELFLMGIKDTAYVRPVTVQGRRVHVVHAADGSILTVAPDRDLAFMTIRQHEMTPASLH